jgi:hypothetical protein
LGVTLITGLNFYCSTFFRIITALAQSVGIGASVLEHRFLQQHVELEDFHVLQVLLQVHKIKYGKFESHAIQVFIYKAKLIMDCNERKGIKAIYFT